MRKFSLARTISALRWPPEPTPCDAYDTVPETKLAMRVKALRIMLVSSVGSSRGFHA
jgi:hypothetical protein